MDMGYLSYYDTLRRYISTLLGYLNNNLQLIENIIYLMTKGIL
jgi:hypothetical protein